MTIDNGSVTVADDGTETKTGFAGLLYDQIYGQEFPLLPDPNSSSSPRAPGLGEAGYVAVSTDRKTLITRAIVAAKKMWARTAVAVAKAAQGDYGAVVAGSTPTTVISLHPPENSRGCYRVTLCGYSGAATNHQSVNVTYNRILTAAPTDVFAAVISSVANDILGVTVSAVAAGNRIDVQAACSSGTLTWTATAIPAHISV